MDWALQAFVFVASPLLIAINDQMNKYMAVVRITMYLYNFALTLPSEVSRQSRRPNTY